MTAFGIELMRHRADGESIATFSRRLGCDESYIWRLTRGTRRPSIDFIDNAADALNLSKRDRDHLVVLAYNVGKV